MILDLNLKNESISSISIGPRKVTTLAERATFELFHVLQLPMGHLTRSYDHVRLHLDYPNTASTTTPTLARRLCNVSIAALPGPGSSDNSLACLGRLHAPSDSDHSCVLACRFFSVPNLQQRIIALYWERKSTRLIRKSPQVFTSAEVVETP